MHKNYTVSPKLNESSENGVKALAEFRGKNSLQNFHITNDSVIRKRAFEDDEEGFSLDSEENSTVLSFLRYDKVNRVLGKPKTEYVKNFDWNSFNNTPTSIEDPILKTETKRSPLNDILSKNITMLLENLLKNYENSQLPTHGKGTCVCFEC